MMDINDLKKEYEGKEYQESLDSLMLKLYQLLRNRFDNNQYTAIETDDYYATIDYNQNGIPLSIRITYLVHATGSKYLVSECKYALIITFTSTGDKINYELNDCDYYLDNNERLELLMSFLCNIQ